MNKLNIFLIILFLLTSCSTKELEQIQDSNAPVIIKLGKKYKKIFRVKIPIDIKIINNSLSEKAFNSIDYKYTPYREGIGEELFKRTHNSITEKISNNQRKTVYPFITKEYVLYARYRLDSSKTTQQQFKPYIEKMLKEGKDTLHIGTVSAFKKNHKTLFERLTKNDSISIQFLDGDALGKRVTVPVEW
jgi:hypothetical protein